MKLSSNTQMHPIYIPVLPGTVKPGVSPTTTDTMFFAPLCTPCRQRILACYSRDIGGGGGGVGGTGPAQGSFSSGDHSGLTVCIPFMMGSNTRGTPKIAARSGPQILTNVTPVFFFPFCSLPPASWPGCCGDRRHGRHRLRYLQAAGAARHACGHR